MGYALKDVDIIVKSSPITIMKEHPENTTLRRPVMYSGVMVSLSYHRIATFRRRFTAVYKGQIIVLLLFYFILLSLDRPKFKAVSFNLLSNKLTLFELRFVTSCCLRWLSFNLTYTSRAI